MSSIHNKECPYCLVSITAVCHKSFFIHIAIFAGSYRNGCYRSTITLDVDDYCGSFHVGTESIPVTVTLAGPCTRGITVTPSVKIGTDDEVFGITIAIPLGIGTEAEIPVVPVAGAIGMVLEFEMQILSTRQPNSLRHQ